MVAVNPNNSVHSNVSAVNRLVERENQFHEQKATGYMIGLTHQEYEEANGLPSIRERSLRIHAWLIGRLLSLQEENLKQRNLRYKLRRFLFDNRLGRWLGF